MRRRRPSASYILLIALLVTLALAGGASRPDVLAQSVARTGAFVALIFAAFCVSKDALRSAGWVPYLLLSAAALPLLQLVPFPSSIWLSLAGREMFAAAVHGQQPWRPLSIAPGMTLNAATSLIVPFAVMILASDIREEEHDALPGVLLGLIAAMMLVGIIQFAGGSFDNPLVNDTPGTVVGPFANRNHFALVLAIGCLVVPVWSLDGQSRRAWHAPVGLGVLILLLLVVLATGSRAGVVLVVVGGACGLFIVRSELGRRFRGLSKRAIAAVVAVVIGSIAALVAISVWADRAASISRAMELDVNTDIRVAALPTVMDMVRTYFPWGTGFGTFDAAFRIHEPFALLQPTYFNRAHNDFLEILLNGGLPALVLLLVAIAWWILASWRVWRSDRNGTTLLGRLGSVIILMTLSASIVDYPARTPLVMGLIILAAIWLNRGSRPEPTID